MKQYTIVTTDATTGRETYTDVVSETRPRLRRGEYIQRERWVGAPTTGDARDWDEYRREVGYSGDHH